VTTDWSIKIVGKRVATSNQNRHYTARAVALSPAVIWNSLVS